MRGKKENSFYEASELGTVGYKLHGKIIFDMFKIELETEEMLLKYNESLD